ncbi:MAG: YgeY family selenium metabolism-linked hydrolase [Chloroflexi bacterium]|nr:YgeY family selenium metabolism-linked hydrolase [Chloroflexota bacterium]
MSQRTSIDREALIGFAQRLVRTPSLPGEEAQVAELTAHEMRRVGFDDVRVDRMGNVIGRIGPGDGRKLLFDAHMDAVDVGDLSAWKIDPYGGEVRRGVLHGRGSADMKGALAAMVYAGKLLAECRRELSGGLYLAAVVQEEPCEGLAIRHVIEEEGVRPDWVVLGEATNLQLSRGQRGRIALRITVRGRSSHAAAPERGVNAIYEAARIIVGLQLLAPQLNNDSFLGRGSLAVTDISSTAGSLNAVPDRCVLHVDRRLTSGETEAKALAEVRRILAREGVDASVEVPSFRIRSYTGYESERRQHFPYWVTPANEPLLLRAMETIEDVLGFVPHVGRWEFSTDGVYTAGEAGIPTIGFGPGEERYAHTTDEQVRTDDLVSAARVYTELTARLLGGR